MLSPRAVERVWGTRTLPVWSPVQAPSDEPVGEIWFEEPGDAELLVKLLFTEDRLSIQVHPDDAAARAIGRPRGKDEAWLVLGAEPGAVIGLGLKQPTDRQTLREAALSGAIEELIDWRPVRTGEIFYSPAGTVHAIGAGLTVMEIQQNLDLTYRLYDYGRPRELHLDEGIEAADPGPWQPAFEPREIGPGRTLLNAGAAFVLERWTVDAPKSIDAEERVLLIPTRDGGEVGGTPLRLGTVLRIEGEARLDGDCDLIVAYPGSEPSANLLA